MDAFVTRKKRQRNDDAPQRPIAVRDASISPPPKRNAFRNSNQAKTPLLDLIGSEIDGKNTDADQTKAKESRIKLIPSPIQLNYVRELPAKSNVDTVKLNDILGDPMIKECWLFNYLFEMDFLM